MHSVFRRGFYLWLGLVPHLDNCQVETNAVSMGGLAFRYEVFVIRMISELANVIWHLYNDCIRCWHFLFDFQNNKHFEFTLGSIPKGNVAKIFSYFRFEIKWRKLPIPSFIGFTFFEWYKHENTCINSISFMHAHVSVCGHVVKPLWNKIYDISQFKDNLLINKRDQFKMGIQVTV